MCVKKRGEEKRRKKKEWKGKKIRRNEIEVGEKG